MVRFLPFDCTDEEGINIVLQHIDFSIQYGEDLEFKEPKVRKSTNTTEGMFGIGPELTVNICAFICRGWRKNLPTWIMMRFFKTEGTAEGSCDSRNLKPLRIMKPDCQDPREETCGGVKTCLFCVYALVIEHGTSTYVVTYIFNDVTTMWRLWNTFLRSIFLKNVNALYMA